MNAEVSEKQKILEIADIKVRSEALLTHLTKEQQMLELKNDIQTKVKVDIDRQQKEYFLHQQMRQIQDELGENPVQQEITELKEKAKAKGFSKKGKKAEVEVEVDGEIKKLSADRILVAVGFRANSQNLGLEKVGVGTDDRGWIPVDTQCRTNVPALSRTQGESGARGSMATSAGASTPLAMKKVPSGKTALTS